MCDAHCINEGRARYKRALILILRFCVLIPIGRKKQTYLKIRYKRRLRLLKRISKKKKNH